MEKPIRDPLVAVTIWNCHGHQRVSNLTKGRASQNKFDWAGKKSFTNNLYSRLFLCVGPNEILENYVHVYALKNWLRLWSKHVRLASQNN